MYLLDERFWVKDSGSPLVGILYKSWLKALIVTDKPSRKFLLDANSYSRTCIQSLSCHRKKYAKKIDPDSSPSEEEKQSKLTEFQEKEFCFLSVAATLIEKNLVVQVYVVEKM